MTRDVPDFPRTIRDIADGLERTALRFDVACRQQDTMADIPQLRRELSGLLTSASFALRADDSGKRDDGEHLLSQVRRIYSLHQTNWPVVIARESPEAFRTSAEKCSAKLRSFIAWLRLEAGRAP